MTKLDELNVFVTERLSVAVNEILHTVSRMMQEYEEETARIRKENDYLKEMIKVTGWSFTEINPGVFLGKDGFMNLQQESEASEGWYQNAEMKEESTSIKIERPDPPYPAYPDSMHTDEFQIPDLEMGSTISDVCNTLKRRKRKSILKLKKKHYCLYCRKSSLRMTQHLLSVHAKEPEVAKALSYDKKSKERKQLLDLLQSKGNLLHKDGVTSKALSSKRHGAAGSNKGSVQCVYCLGLYSSKSITNHVKRCKHKDPSKVEAITASHKSSAIASQPGIALSAEITPATQVSSPNSYRSHTSKQESPNPESVSSHVSDTHHSSAKICTDTESTPCEDFGLVGEELFADLEKDSDFTTDTSLVRNEHVHKRPKCSSPVYDQHDTSKSEEQKTDTEHSSRNGHLVENLGSCHVETQSSVIENASDEEESTAQNMQLYICQHCSATFCSPYHLRRHEYTHTGERPFWCSECNMGFIQKYRYRNHRVTYHEERHLRMYTDHSRKCKKRSCSGEKQAEDEQLAEISKKGPDSANTGSLPKFKYEKITDNKEDSEPMNEVTQREPVNGVPEEEPVNGVAEGEPVNGVPEGEPVNGMPESEPVNGI